MALDTMIAEVNKAREAYEAKRKEIDGTFAKELAIKVAELAEGKEVEWTQYTDYFNDGEACEFGVHYWETPKPVRALLQTIPTQLFEDAFGDHVKITVSPDGTYTVSSYEHHD